MGKKGKLKDKELAIFFLAFALGIFYGIPANIIASWIWEGDVFSKKNREGMEQRTDI